MKKLNPKSTVVKVTLQQMLKDVYQMSTEYERLRIELPDTDAFRKIENAFFELQDSIQEVLK